MEAAKLKVQLVVMVLQLSVNNSLAYNDESQQLIAPAERTFPLSPNYWSAWFWVDKEYEPYDSINTPGSIENTPSGVRLFNLSGNNIQELDRFSFSKMCNLEELDLSNNRIESFPSWIFRFNTCLRKLNLSRNPLKLHKGPLLENDRLSLLNLTRCGLQEIPPDTFSQLPRLKVLDLSENQISVIDAKAFQKLPHLRKLLLHGNPLLCSCQLYKYVKERNVSTTDDRGRELHCFVSDGGKVPFSSCQSGTKVTASPKHRASSPSSTGCQPGTTNGVHTMLVAFGIALGSLLILLAIIWAVMTLFCRRSGVLPPGTLATYRPQLVCPKVLHSQRLVNASDPRRLHPPSEDKFVTIKTIPNTWSQGHALPQRDTKVVYATIMNTTAPPTDGPRKDAN